MILVDSSVWIDHFNGRTTRETALLDTWLGTVPILTGDLILTEVLQGFRSETEAKQAETALSMLFYADMAGRRVALQSAANYRRLRANGVTVRKTIDVLIATFCVEFGHALLHSDRDFTVLAPHLGLQTL